MSFKPDEYTQELEKMVIWLCDVYNQTQDSLACHETDGETDGNWFKVFCAVPTIQGSYNRMMIKRIGALRTRLGNREGFKLSLDDIYERLSVGRKTPAPTNTNPITKERESNVS